MEDPQYEYRKQRYEVYSKARYTLDSASLEISSRYDRYLITLSGGALTLSLVFIEKIAPHPQVWTLSTLLISWLSLTVSIVLELIALASSQSALQLQIAILDFDYYEFLSRLDGASTEAIPKLQHPPASNENKYSRRTRSLNMCSLWALGIGILFLCIFSSVNIYYFDEGRPPLMAEKINESRGSYVPPSNILPPPPPPLVVSPTPVPAASSVAPPSSAPVTVQQSPKQ